MERGFASLFFLLELNQQVECPRIHRFVFRTQHAFETGFSNSLLLLVTCQRKVERLFDFIEPRLGIEIDSLATTRLLKLSLTNDGRHRVGGERIRSTRTERLKSIVLVLLEVQPVVVVIDFFTKH